MQRLLVWPWHGLVKDGSIQLPNGGIRSYSQPLNFATLAYGPGDNHKIVVRNIQPLTKLEQENAPEGGKYWAGQALITGASLYDKVINGWIYQAADGSRWRVSIIRRLLTANDATVELSASLFGVFGKASETHTTTLSVPVGFLTDRRALIFADLGPASASVIRLHSVSETGRTAIFAWMAYNVPGQGNTEYEKVFDFRPRPYMYYKVSIKGSHAQLSIRGEVLYRLDDIFSVAYERSGSGLGCDFGSASPMVELRREPNLDANGVLNGEKVFYEFGKQVPIELRAGGRWQSPFQELTKTRWMVMLAFSGETPTPRYLTIQASQFLSSPSFERFTDEEFVEIEYPSGEVDIVTQGSSHIEGGASSGSNLTIRFEGGGSEWGAQVSASATYHTLGNTQTTTLECAGRTSSSVLSGPFVMLPMPIGLFDGEREGRVPMASQGFDGLSKAYLFTLYSNNLIGVSMRTSTADEKFIGYLTPDGFTARATAYPSDDIHHYGSYNPFTKECVIGSKTPVNWV